MLCPQKSQNNIDYKENIDGAFLLLGAFFESAFFESAFLESTFFESAFSETYPYGIQISLIYDMANSVL